MINKTNTGGARMQQNYIQLPPLPSDMPLESVEMIWLYAQISDEKRDMLLEFIWESFYNNTCLEKPEISKAMWSSCTEINPDVLEFANLMKKLARILIVQAYEMAALIYQGYCIGGKSIEELSEEYHIDEESIQLMTQYYDNKIKS